MTSLRFLVLALFALLTACSNQSKAPDLNFSDIDGQPHSLITPQAKATLVIFWATDCPGCIQEMPELIELHHAYNQQDLNMVGVAMSYDSLDHIKTMRAQKQLPYVITWDKNSQISQAFNNVRVTPTHFLIDAKGDIVMRKIGELNIELLKSKLDSMGLKPA